MGGPGSIPSTSIGFEMRTKQKLGQMIPVEYDLGKFSCCKFATCKFAKASVFLFATKNFLSEIPEITSYISLTKLFTNLNGVVLSRLCDWQQRITGKTHTLFTRLRLKIPAYTLYLATL